MSGALPGSPLHTLDTDRIPISREFGEIGATGKPDARPGAPTAPFDSTPDQSPSPRGGPSPPSSTRRHTPFPATNEHEVAIIKPRLAPVDVGPIDHKQSGVSTNSETTSEGLDSPGQRSLYKRSHRRLS